MSDQQEISLMGELKPAFESPKTVQNNIRIFRETVEQILDPNVDTCIISGKRHIKKSGWNALNQYFGVETKPTASWRTELEDGEYMITVVVQCSLDEKRKQSRSASCTSMEMKEKHGGKQYLGMESHCYGMAETRAVGRASAAWYMIGDNTAEEMNNLSKDTTIPKGTQRACKCAKPNCEPNSRECKDCGGLDFS